MILPDSVIVVLLLALIAFVIMHKEIFAAYDEYRFNEAVTLAENRMKMFTAAGYYDDKSEEQFYADYTEMIDMFYNKR